MNIYDKEQTGLTMEAARKQAGRIEAFWKAKGVIVQPEVTRSRFGWVVRSDMLNGLPRKYG